MDITEEFLDKYVKISPNGDLDASSSIQVDETVQKWLQNGVLFFHIDCSNLTYISSAGLGVFMSYMEEINQNGGKMVFSNMTPKVFNVFELLGLNQVMTIVESIQDAEKQLQLWTLLPPE